jgi:hypothetical protein
VLYRNGRSELQLAITRQPAVNCDALWANVDRFVFCTTAPVGPFAARPFRLRLP